MSNLTTLIKVGLRETFDKRKFKENKKQKSFFIYIILMGLLFVGISTLYSIIYAMQYVVAENTDMLYTLSMVFFIASTFVVFSSAISRMQSIFLGNDYELLAAMPIRQRDIVAAKCFNLYLSELAVCLVTLLPNAVVNFCITLDYRYFVLIPLAFITPAFPMLVSLIIVALIELLIKNPKVKTIISTVIMLLLVTGLAVVSMISGFTTSSSTAAPLFEALSTKAMFINPSLMFLIKAFSENFLWVLAYVGSNLLLLVLVLFIVIISYRRIHNNMMAMTLNSQTKKNNKEIQYESKSQFKTFFSLTAKQFFKSKNSLVQCGIGVIMMVLFTVMAVVILKQGIIVGEGEESFDLLDYMYPYGFIVPILLAMFGGIMPPSATAVSLEGKNFYTLKTLPISFKDYLLVKVLFSFIFLGTSSLISSIIWVIFIPQTVFSIIISILFPLAFALFTTIFTLIINATFPYLNWKEEIEVYKYHKSTVITVFTDMGISIASVILAIGLCILSPYISGAAILTVFVGLDILLYFILTRKTSRKLEFLEVSD